MTSLVQPLQPVGPTARLCRAVLAPGVLAVLAGVAAMTLVGGSTAVSGLLTRGPLLTAQALRYAVASLLLVALARPLGQVVRLPRGREWLWLVAVTGTGLMLFNVALVHGAAHAEPAVYAVAVACVPVLLALGEGLTGGTRPGARLLLAGLVVTGGAALVTGFGRADAVGILWAVVVLGCEAGFTVLALPVLGRLGPWGVSVHTTWIAALGFGIGGVVTEGPGAVLTLTRAEVAATAFLAVGVTALAFLLWYSCVGRLGAGRAGLLTGVAPVAAAVGGVALGGPAPAALVWVGIAVIGVGLVVGLRQRPRRRHL